MITHPTAAPADAGATRAVLSARGLAKRFGSFLAVNNVDIDVHHGRIHALIGPNGAGKSTTFDLITGMNSLSGGRILFEGKPLAGRSPRDIARQGVARTFQHPKILPGMSVLENVALGAHQRGRGGVLQSILRLDRTEEAALLAEAMRQLERVGLAEFKDRPAGDLALGQVRILEIARALALDPVVLLLDEPAAGLRYGEKQELAALLKKLRGEGMSILLVEHDMSFVMELVDHIVVLDFGTRIAEGKPQEVRQNPAVIAAYLGGAA